MNETPTITAYAQAPSILREMNHVLALTGQLQQPDGRTPETIREQRLRKAALLDRIELQEVGEYAPGLAPNALATAIHAARELALFDAEHGTSAGPIGPASPECTRDPRAYVRQEYAAWHASA